MKARSLVGITFFVGIQFLPQAQAITFTAHTCADSKKIVREIIDYELSGGRWQGGHSKCLKQSRFQTIFAKRQDAGDAYLLQPEYLLADDEEVKVVAQKKNSDLGAIEVEIGYLATKNEPKSPAASAAPAPGPETFVKDRFTYRLNYGRNREKLGCVTLIEEPAHFVMKKECLKP